MKSRILTVNREFESAGNEIAQAVAERLGIPYYDRFLITNVAEEMGFDAATAEKHDEKPISRFQLSESQAAFFYTSPSTPAPTGVKIAEAQFDLIRKIADEGPCVIVGRCAGYVLHEAQKDVVSIFIHAGVESRIKRTMQSLKISESEATKILKQTDKGRRIYHHNYTGLEWNDPEQYDMILNTDKVSFDECVDLICSLYNAD